MTKQKRDSYGDGDVPEIDTISYEDNSYDPHPEAGGDNHTDENSEG